MEERFFFKKETVVSLSASCRSAQGLVISSNHILLLGRPQLNLHLQYCTRRHPPLPTPLMWRLGASTFTPHTHALHPRHLSAWADRCTYTRTHFYMDTTCTISTHTDGVSKGRWKYAAILWDDMGLDMLVMCSAMTTLTTHKTAPPPSSPPQGLVEEWLHEGCWQLSQTSSMTGS